MMHEKLTPAPDTVHVDVLDGIRGLAVLIVVWYHLWQQSWLMPVFRTPALRFLGINVINLDFIPRTGFLWVDMMMLLSAFCLFLPHARNMLLGEPQQDTRSFYLKRFARIVPSYVLCVLIIFFGWCLPTGAYTTFRQGAKDLVANLTFTMTFSSSTYISSKINGVLWTAAVEMQFYLLFPLLAKAFRKRPFLTWTAMVLVSELYLRLNTALAPGSLRMTLNQVIGFFGVFVNGFAGACLYVLLAKRVRYALRITVPATALFLLGLKYFSIMAHATAAAQQVQVYQAENRLFLSLLFLGLILALSFAVKPLRFLFSSHSARFFGAISYNLYLWHQWFAVRLKEWHIPAWSGDVPPNQAGNFTWQWQYMLLCAVLSIAVATLITYLFERPVRKLLLRDRSITPHT